MKLLLDEMLPARLASRLADLHPGSVHVADLGLSGARDTADWARALNDGYVIVTKDGDFQRLSLARGAPPKVIRIRLGNCTGAEIEHLLRAGHVEIMRALAEPDTTFVSVG